MSGLKIVFPKAAVRKDDTRSRMEQPGRVSLCRGRSQDFLASVGAAVTFQNYPIISYMSILILKNKATNPGGCRALRCCVCQVGIVGSAAGLVSGCC